MNCELFISCRLNIRCDIVCSVFVVNLKSMIVYVCVCLLFMGSMLLLVIVYGTLGICYIWLSIGLLWVG